MFHFIFLFLNHIFSCGGVELCAFHGRIRVNNTLENRLEMIAGQMLPEMRTKLFNANPNRKFFD